MAPRRQQLIAQSIQYSLLHPDDQPGFISSISSRFYTYSLTFRCIHPEHFKSLRSTWHISEGDYYSSFDGEDALKSMGDMGFSGSTFFRTKDGGYLVKSVPRHFEHSFFRDDMLVPYVDYMNANPSSLLVRITDFLESVQHSLGSLLGTAPSHHIVMENILYGQGEAERKAEKDEESEWRHWDLKPMSYFYPERDVAGGALTSEATKSKLADDFDESLILSLDQAEDFKAQLAKDTKLLADCNAVDYSLFLVRIPLTTSASSGTLPPKQPPFVPPEPPSWRTGIRSADGKFVYRAALLDFFWAKHKAHAKAMTGLINAYNVFDRKGPMSVTTNASEYRDRFLKMCEEMVKVQ
jgi:hypothetical protein